MKSRSRQWADSSSPFYTTHVLKDAQIPLHVSGRMVQVHTIHQQPTKRGNEFRINSEDLNKSPTAVGGILPAVKTTERSRATRFALAPAFIFRAFGAAVFPQTGPGRRASGGAGEGRLLRKGGISISNFADAAPAC